jgi:hypothetical protein
MAHEAVPLGEITCPSGELVLLDAGYLGLWSADAAPATGGVDLHATGPDAKAAARTFDGNPSLYRYDVPAPAAPEYQRIFRRHCGERMLEARLTAYPSQVPHRHRVTRAIAARDPGFSIMGVPVAAVGRIPRDRPLPVTATPDRHLTLAVGQGPATVRVEHGRVGLDHGRVALADADALASWIHDDPLDGQADVVLWGREAPVIAAEFGVPPDSSRYAWLDLPFDEAAARSVALEERKEKDHDAGFEVELRPHSHLWRIQRAIAASPHSAATIDIGDATILIAGIAEGLIPVEITYDVARAPVSIELPLSS